MLELHSRQKDLGFQDCRAWLSGAKSGGIPSGRQKSFSQRIFVIAFSRLLLISTGIDEGLPMRRLNPEFVEKIRYATNRSPYFSLLSMKIVELEIGRSVLEIDLEEKHLQPFGFVHGGVFSSIIDAAAFWAVYIDVDANVGMTSVDLNLNYLAPAAKGKLIARGRRIKLGKTLGLGEAEVTDADGRILAHGTSKLMVVPGMGIAEFAGLPEKFLED